MLSAASRLHHSERRAQRVSTLRTMPANKNGYLVYARRTSYTWGGSPFLRRFSGSNLLRCSSCRRRSRWYLPHVDERCAVESKTKITISSGRLLKVPNARGALKVEDESAAKRTGVDSAKSFLVLVKLSYFAIQMLRVYLVCAVDHGKRRRDCCCCCRCRCEC